MAVAFVVGGLMVSTSVAHGQTPVGCSTADLTTAIANANSGGGGTLDLATGCTYTLGSALPEITSTVTLDGGVNQAALEGTSGSG